MAIKKTFWLIGAGVLVIGFFGMIVIYLLMGFQGVWKIIKGISIFLLIIGCIALAVYLIWFLFIRKQKFDVTAVNKKKLSIAGQYQCPETIKNRDLRLSGDRGHSSVIFGKIKGFLKIRVLNRKLVFENNKPVYHEEGDRRTPLYQLSDEVQDVFIVKKGGFLSNIFEDPKVVRIKPEDHSELVGDVTVYGVNLVPISEYWFLEKDYLDVRTIDRSILLEAERGVLFESLKDMKTMLDQAINLDQKHRKIIEEKSLVEVPQFKNLAVNQ
jgi:hypothetical protein